MCNVFTKQYVQIVPEMSRILLLFFFLASSGELSGGRVCPCSQRFGIAAYSLSGNANKNNNNDPLEIRASVW